MRVCLAWCPPRLITAMCVPVLGVSALRHAHVPVQLRLAWSPACLTVAGCARAWCVFSESLGFFESLSFWHMRVPMRVCLAWGLACLITASRVLAFHVSALSHACLPMPACLA
jgi:hypothetical protein